MSFCSQRERGLPIPPGCKPPGVGETPQMQTPWGWTDPPGLAIPPWMQTPPGFGQTPQVRQTPLDADPRGWADPQARQTPWMQTSRGWADPPGCRPPGLGRPPPPNTVNKRAVRILLECILVFSAKGAKSRVTVAKQEVCALNPASYLCWNMHVGKVTGCYAGHIHWQRCRTRDESQGTYQWRI